MFKVYTSAAVTEVAVIYSVLAGSFISFQWYSLRVKEMRFRLEAWGGGAELWLRGVLVSRIILLQTTPKRSALWPRGLLQPFSGAGRCGSWQYSWERVTVTVRWLLLRLLQARSRARHWTGNQVRCNPCLVCSKHTLRHKCPRAGHSASQALRSQQSFRKDPLLSPLLPDSPLPGPPIHFPLWLAHWSSVGRSLVWGLVPVPGDLEPPQPWEGTVNVPDFWTIHLGQGSKEQSPHSIVTEMEAQRG